MRLKVERRGGFVGKLATGERDVGELSPVQREALDALFDAPQKPGRSPGADRFQYKLQLVGDGVTKEIEVPEDSMPDELASIARINP
jgi:hypothetical protein